LVSHHAVQVWYIKPLNPSQMGPWATGNVEELRYRSYIAQAKELVRKIAGKEPIPMHVVAFVYGKQRGTGSMSYEDQ